MKGTGRDLRRNVHALLRSAAIGGAVCCAVLFGGVGVATAQSGAPNAPGRWTVTPSFLIGTGGDLDSTGAGFGLAAGYAWNPHWAWEAAFNTLPSVDQGALLTVNSSIWTVSGNVLRYFTADRPFSPYLAGGIGFGHGSADIPANLNQFNLNDSSTNFIVNLGGGLSRTLTDRVNVRADLRYFIGSDLVPDFWRIGLGVGFDVGRH